MEAAVEAMFDASGAWFAMSGGDCKRRLNMQQEDM